MTSLRTSRCIGREGRGDDNPNVNLNLNANRDLMTREERWNTKDSRLMVHDS